MYVDLVAEAHSGSCRTLEMALSSGSLCSEHLFNQLKKKFNLQRVCVCIFIVHTGCFGIKVSMIDNCINNGEKSLYDHVVYTTLLMRYLVFECES